MDRMTLNNSVQDPSMVNTCLAYEVFAAAGNPAPRCNFANVTVNGMELGLYVHVEELKKPFLARHFDSAAGNCMRVRSATSRRHIAARWKRKPTKTRTTGRT